MCDNLTLKKYSLQMTVEFKRITFDRVRGIVCVTNVLGTVRTAKQNFPPSPVEIITINKDSISLLVSLTFLDHYYYNY